MNLVKVTGTAFRVTCIKCGKKAESDQVQFYADTEGTPWFGAKIVQNKSVKGY